ncbi:MAG: radical SAM protein [Desulfomonilia bacterium]
MYWKLNPKIDDILKKSRDREHLSDSDAMMLLNLDLNSREVYALMETADALSRETFYGKGENHFHIGINVEPCPFNCSFCSLTKQAGIFTSAEEFDIDMVLDWARLAEDVQADAINVMTTGMYDFERFLEIGRNIHAEVSTPLVANTRDITHAEGERLLDAGFVGCYHALRLGEGKDTPFSPEKRLKTIKVIKDVGLLWMNCVEPVGPEHTREDIARLMVLARENGATYSGVMRRINFPGSPCESRGMITERELARMVAVSRLVMGDTVKAHCTHEPNTATLLAGANLFFPEVGASPRDSIADTGKGRGQTLAHCRILMIEMGLDPDLPSNCFPRTGNQLRSSISSPAPIG